ncbi:MAG: hypothetical protein HW388_705 [Dehalococcoidia bacterium]|nr:hypothetical protein [Dehalococcoidia bacterium]
MVVQHRGQLPEGVAVSRKKGTAFLEKVGWGILGAAVALWGIASLALMYSGASTHTGWGLLVAFVALVVVGLTLIAAGGPIERSLLRQPSLQGELAPSPEDLSWVEQWNELMQRPVR